MNLLEESPVWKTLDGVWLFPISDQYKRCPVIRTGEGALRVGLVRDQLKAFYLSSQALRIGERASLLAIP